MRYLFLLGVVAITFFMLVACEPAGHPQVEISSAQQKPFLIAIVGNGVPGAVEPFSRELPKDTASGLAMWKGAEAAFVNSSRLGVARKFIELAAFDDGANPAIASEIARKIRADPRVLAVIGHTTSTATGSAAHIYAQAGIPLLMPIATGPYAAMPPGTREAGMRLKNSFRLAPSDDRVQAPALAFVASKKLNAQRCFLLADASSAAVREYSEPLFDNLASMLDRVGILAQKAKLDERSPSMSAWAAKVKALKTDLLIFCGYGSTATELLDAVRKEYKDIEFAKRPKILLSDGCKIGPPLDTDGFSVFLTFPLPTTLSSSLNKTQAPNAGPTPSPVGSAISDLGFLKMAIQGQGVESYQMYAYDAMLMIGDATAKCSAKNVISRDCIQDQLNHLENFPGATLIYSFVGGENSLSRYYVYSNTKQPKGDLIFDYVIQPEDIQQLAASSSE